MGCANSKDVPDLDRTTTKEGHVEAFLAEPSEEREPDRVASPDPPPPRPIPQEVEGLEITSTSTSWSTDPPTPAESRPPPPTPTTEEPQNQGQNQGQSQGQSQGQNLEEEQPPVSEAAASDGADEVSPLPVRATSSLGWLGGANAKQVPAPPQPLPPCLTPHPASLCRHRLAPLGADSNGTIL